MATISSPQLSDAVTGDVAPVCLAVRACLDEYVDGEMSELKTATIMAHLQSCPMCRRAEHALRTLIASVRQSQLSVLASRRLRLRVAQLFDAQESRER
jgi:anti-sigma factor RsiW